MDPLEYNPIISKVMESIITVDIKSFIFSNSLIKSQIINSDSDRVSLPWTCCFFSPNNGGGPQYQT